MLLIHEGLGREAQHAKHALEQTFGLAVTVREANLGRFFAPIDDRRWSGCLYCSAWAPLMREHPDTAVMLLTARDVYDYEREKDPEDAWVFGVMVRAEHHAILSVARLRTVDGRPSAPEVDERQYRRRVRLMAIHEVAHDLLGGAAHHQEAAWVNARTGKREELGPHCDDNTCAMYEVVDVATPSAEAGYLQLGSSADARRFDAGLDEHIDRVGDGNFCVRCRAVIRIPAQYCVKG